MTPELTKSRDRWANSLAIASPVSMNSVAMGEPTVWKAAWNKVSGRRFLGRCPTTGAGGPTPLANDHWQVDVAKVPVSFGARGAAGGCKTIGPFCPTPPLRDACHHWCAEAIQSTQRVATDLRSSHLNANIHGE